jgi:hypothetical protein
LTPFALASARPLAGAFEDAAAFELRGNTKGRKDDLSKIRSGIEERLGQ